VVFWSKENSNFTQELQHNPPHVMIWVGMTSDYRTGPYFFDGPVNAASYSELLETWLIPQLRDRELLDDVWLQHDGAPAHFAFFARCFERTFSRPLDWPWLTDISGTIGMATT